jgi:hypothetical protein
MKYLIVILLLNIFCWGTAQAQLNTISNTAVMLGTTVVQLDTLVISNTYLDTVNYYYQPTYTPQPIKAKSLLQVEEPSDNFIALRIGNQNSIDATLVNNFKLTNRVVVLKAQHQQALVSGTAQQYSHSKLHLASTYTTKHQLLQPYFSFTLWRNKFYALQELPLSVPNTAFNNRQATIVQAGVQGNSLVLGNTSKAITSINASLFNSGNTQEQSAIVQLPYTMRYNNSDAIIFTPSVQVARTNLDTSFQSKYYVGLNATYIKYGISKKQLLLISTSIGLQGGKLLLLPDVKYTTPLADTQALLTVGITSNQQLHTLAQLYNSNQFISLVQQFAAGYSHQVYVHLNKQWRPTLVAQLHIGVQRSINTPAFINYTIPNSVEASTLSLVMHQRAEQLDKPLYSINTYGQLHYQLNSNTQLGGTIAYTNYSLLTPSSQQYLYYNLPQLIASLYGHYQYGNWLKLQAQWWFTTGVTGGSLTQARQFKGGNDLQLSSHIKLASHWQLLLSTYNLLNSSYYNFAHYKAFGTRVQAGVKYMW